jgi:hypothetical protein
MSDSSLHHDPNLPVNAVEMQAIADRTRWRSYSSLIGAATSIVAMLAFVIVGILFLNSANKGNTLDESTNCARQYSSILGGPVTIRDNLTSQVAALVGDGQGIFGTALLNVENGISPSPAVIAAFQANASALAAKTVELNAAIAVVKKLPTTAEATTHGFTFAGHHYPACPGG